jgi:hypothetical protein
MTVRWAERVADLLEFVRFEPVLGESVVVKTADAILHTRMLRDPPDRVAAAIDEGLAGTVRLTELAPGGRDEADFRDFLARLRRRLEDLRPWPEWRYEQVGRSAWGASGVRPVAHLALSTVRLGNLLGVLFERVTEAGTAVDMVVLRLADGPTVALAREVGSSRPGTGLLVRGVEPADAVLAAFLGATGIGRDQVTWVADDGVRRERARMTGPVGLRHGRAYDVDTGRIGVGHVSDPAVAGRWRWS